MLFDLRSRGRRRTVQVVYIGLAVLIGAGLILFGVGTGSGGGGLLGGLTGSGSSNSAKSAVTAQTRKAIAQTKAHPQSASAWAALVVARRAAANTAGYDSTTGTYTAAGKQQLSYATKAYEKYVTLTKTPTVNASILAGQSYTQLAQYKSAADAYQSVLAAEPGNLHALECVSLTSYAAGNTRVGGLAETRVLAKLPKAARKTTRTELEGAKKTPSIAASAC